MNNLILTGLSDQEVEALNKQNLNNDYQIKSYSYLKIISNNLFTLFNFLNLLILSLIIISGRLINALFFLTITINSLLAIYQEIKAKKMLNNLQFKKDIKIKVLRNGAITLIDAKNLVLNDYVILEKGSIIPCDGDIIQGEIKVDESIITGESKEIFKKTRDFIYKYSIVNSGNAVYKVKQVKNNNYVDDIESQAKKYKEGVSELKKITTTIIKIISYIIIPLSIINFIKLYFFNNLIFNDALLRLSASMIGMIPEGLILLSSSSLYLSIIKLSKNNILINQLYSLETLAKCDVICFDKTGTLTTNQMTVSKVIYLDFDYSNLIANIADKNIDNPSNIALKKYFKIKEILNFEKFETFNSTKKYTELQLDNNHYYLGAFEALPIDHNLYQNFIQQQNPDNKRIICLSDKKLLALILLDNELKPEITETIEYLYQEKLSLKIISGDNLKTVENIARQVGIINYQKILDFSNLDENIIINDIEQYNIFTRVKPKQKKMIIEQLQKNHTVAMIGDGINDIPAMKIADFSISFESANNSCKNIANAIFLDDSFKNLHKIILEGRRVINHINLSASLFLNKTFFTIFLTVLSVIFLDSYPFIPIHFTFISSFCIGIPSFILSFEANHQAINNNLKQHLIRVSSFSFSSAIICAIIHYIKLNNFYVLVFSFLSFIIVLKDTLKNKSKFYYFLLTVSVFGFFICIIFFNIFLYFDLNYFINIFIILILYFLIKSIIEKLIQHLKK